MIDYKPTTKHLPGAMTDCEAEMLRRWQAARGLVYCDWKFYNREECMAIYGLVRFGYLKLVKFGGIALHNRKGRTS